MSGTDLHFKFHVVIKAGPSQHIGRYGDVEGVTVHIAMEGGGGLGTY